LRARCSSSLHPCSPLPALYSLRSSSAHRRRAPLLLSCLLIPRPPTSTLFPYTTLFRSCVHRPCYELEFLAYVAGVGVGYIGQKLDRKSTRLNSSHVSISYAVFCLKKKKTRGSHYCSSARALE